MSEHYRNGIETIDVMEQLMTQPGELPELQRMLLGHALKYILRAGCKAGVPWQHDLAKALDYAHRALHGTWAQKTVFHWKPCKDLTQGQRCNVGTARLLVWRQEDVWRVECALGMLCRVSYANTLEKAKAEAEADYKEMLIEAEV